METAKLNWVDWLEDYWADKFYDAFMKYAQNAKGSCLYCGNDIYLNIPEIGGIPDWKLRDGDYGCNQSPETNEEGCGGHKPEKLED